MDNVYKGLVVVAFLLATTVLSQTDREFRTFRGPCVFDARNSRFNASCTSKGTILLGGVFPLHSWKPDERSPIGGYCSGALHKAGFQRMEAMRFAIEQVNAAEIIPGVRLAFEMRDSCRSPDLTRQHAIRFINRGIGSGDHCNTTVRIPVSGVVGAASSSSSIAAADLLGLFKVPQISYASTSATLSNKQRYRYFLRTVPPDKFQAQVIMSLIDALEAKYFSLVHSKGNYGEDGAEEIRAAAAAAAERSKNKDGSGVCIAVDQTVGANTADAAQLKTVYKDVMNDLAGKVGRNASVVVAFTGIDSSLGFLEEAEKAGFGQSLSDHHIWIASDAWANSDQVAESTAALNTARGSLGVEPQSSTVNGFEHHIRSLHPDNNTGPSFNPWLDEFWHSVFNCTLDNPDDKERKACRQERLSSSSYKFQQEAFVPFVIDAVYTFAYAIRQLQKQKCGERSREICPAMLSSETARLGAIDGAALLPNLLNLQFKSSAGHEVAFTSSGDLATAGYDITNLQFDQATREGIYKPVGSWHRLTHGIKSGPSRRVVNGVLNLVHCLSGDEPAQFNCTPAELRLNLSAIQWRNGSFGAQKMPKSRCSFPCQAGHYAKSLKYPFAPKLSRCCWECEQCSQHFVTSTPFQTCQRCPARQRTNNNQTGCIDLSPDFWSLADGQAVACVVLSIVGACLTIVTVFVGVSLKDRLPTCSALHIETLLHCLAGAFGLFTSVFITINKPTSKICLTYDVWVSLSMTLLVTPFLIQFGFLILENRRKSKPVIIVTYEQESSDEIGQQNDGNGNSSTFVERMKATITLVIIMVINVVISTATAASVNVKIDEEVNANTRLTIGCPIGRTAIAGGMISISVAIATIAVRLYIYCVRRALEVTPTLSRAAFIMVVFLVINTTGMGVSALLSPLAKAAMLSFVRITVAFAFVSTVIIPDLHTAAFGRDDGASPEENFWTSLGSRFKTNRGNNFSNTNDIEMTTVQGCSQVEGPRSVNTPKRARAAVRAKAEQ